MDLNRLFGSDSPFREYRPGDEEGIHRIFEETPMRVGGMELVYERRPRVQTQLEYQANQFGIVVGDRDGEIRGVSSFSWGRRWVGEKMTSALYLGDFRVKLDRRIAAKWRSTYPRLLSEFQSNPTYGPSRWFVTGILKQNKAAQKSLVEKNQGFFYHRIAELMMVNLFFRPKKSLSTKIRIVTGVEVGEERLRGFLQETNRKRFLGYDFGFEAGNEWDRRIRVWPGFGVESFLVALSDRGEILSCTLPWAPTQAKRLRVNRLGGGMATVFRLLTIFGARTPQVGAPFKTLYLTHLVFARGTDRTVRAQVIAAFIDRVFREREKYDFHMLSYADSDQLRLLPPLRNPFTQNTPADVYLVTTENQRPEIPENDGIVFEMALV